MVRTSDSLLAEKIAYLKKEEQRDVLHAMEKAIEWHEGQLRSSGEPYVEHPIAVTEYLTTLKAGRDTLIASLLHDVVEDDRATLEEVEELFGETVGMLVDGVTKLSKLQYEGRRSERQIASLRKLLLTAHDDLRVIFIKLADRWHNVQTLDALREDKKMRIARETLDIYVPFARLVGLWQLKSELEETCFPIAYPEESAEWKAAIAEVRDRILKERQAFVSRINAETTDEVLAEIDFMTDYEVFTKFHGDISRVQEVRSLDTVHIVVQSDADDADMQCYRIIGEIHKQYPVLMGSFRDYISAPQANGYAALHTTIFLAKNHLVRLRIQTQAMNEFASNRKLSDWKVDPEVHLQEALGSLKQSSTDDKQYLIDLKTTVLRGRIQIYTPSGEVIALPQGATGVDYAYAVNPGHIRFLEGIVVNGETALPTHILKDGDSVDLMLSKSSNGVNGTQRLWMEKVKSVEAREALKKSISHTTTEHKHESARQMLKQELEKQKLPYSVIFHVSKLQEQLASALSRSSFDQLMKDIGTGIIPISSVVEAYKNIIQEKSHWVIQLLSFFHLLPKSRVLNKEASIIDIEVYATDRQGLIHDITKCIAQYKLNIAKFGVFALPQNMALYRIRLEVKNFEEFSELYDSLLQVPCVTKILRKK